MVFEPDAAPREREAFLEWYDQQTEWSEGHSYNDPAVCSPKLRAWFMEIVQQFAPMNGPLSRRDLSSGDASAVTDYSVGKHVIYAAFAASRGQQAYDAVFELSRKHEVGFFDVSDNGEVWLPVNGEYVLAHKGTNDD